MGGDAAPDTRFPGLPDGLRWDGLRPPDTRAPDVPDVRAPDSALPDPWASSAVTITYQRSVSLTFVTLKTAGPNLGGLTYVGDVLYATVVSVDVDEVAKVNVQDGKVHSEFVSPPIGTGLASDGTYLFLDRSSEYAKHQVNGSSAGTVPSELEGNGGGMEIAQNVLYQVGAGGKGGGVYGVDLASKQTSFVSVPQVGAGWLLATSPRTFILGLFDSEIGIKTPELSLMIHDRYGKEISTKKVTQPFVALKSRLSGMAWNGKELAVADAGRNTIHFYTVH